LPAISIPASEPFGAVYQRDPQQVGAVGPAGLDGDRLIGAPGQGGVDQQHVQGAAILGRQRRQMPLLQVGQVDLDVGHAERPGRPGQLPGHAGRPHQVRPVDQLGGRAAGRRVPAMFSMPPFSPAPSWPPGDPSVLVTVHPAHLPR
jgi:hypothetical protein